MPQLPLHMSDEPSGIKLHRSKLRRMLDAREELLLYWR
jgi:hypothetical protein